MKKIVAFLICVLVTTGCSSSKVDPYDVQGIVWFAPGANERYTFFPSENKVNNGSLYISDSRTGNIIKRYEYILDELFREIHLISLDDNNNNVAFTIGFKSDSKIVLSNTGDKDDIIALNIAKN